MKNRIITFVCILIFSLEINSQLVKDRPGLPCEFSVEVCVTTTHWIFITVGLNIIPLSYETTECHWECQNN